MENFNKRVDINSKKGKSLQRKMFIKMVIGAFFKRKSRLMTGVLSISLGTCVFFGLISIYLDIPEQMSKEFRNYGANIIFLPQNQHINEKDVDIVKKEIQKYDGSNIAEYKYINGRINEQPVIISATDIKAAYKVNPFWYITGSTPKSEDEVIVGQEIANLLDAKSGSLLELYVKDSNENLIEVPLKVSGILQTGKVEEGFIFADYNYISSKINVKGDYDLIEASVVGKKQTLNKIHNDISDMNIDVQPIIVKKIANSEASVLQKLQTLIYIVNLIVLILTMICVSTSMMSAVMERMREIGLKKALGAENSSIIKEFTVQAIFLGILGAIIGIALGYGFAYGVGIKVFSSAIKFNFTLAFFSLLSSVIIMSISSLLPINSAMKIEPAIVLKGE